MCLWHPAKKVFIVNYILQVCLNFGVWRYTSHAYTLPITTTKGCQERLQALKNRAIQNITDGTSTLAVPDKGFWANLGGASVECPVAIVVFGSNIADIASWIRLCLPGKIPLAVCFVSSLFSSLEKWEAHTTVTSVSFCKLN